MVSKGMVTAVLAWLEHVEALGFTPEQIDKLADEYLEVQGVIPPQDVPKHGVASTRRGRDGSVWGSCYCGFNGSRNQVNIHLDDTAPTISTYCPPEKDTHTLRGDSIGMGVHERWWCSCGVVYDNKTVAQAHADFSNSSF